MKKPSSDKDIPAEMAKRGPGEVPPLIRANKSGGLTRSVDPWRQRVSTLFSLFPPAGPRTGGRPGGVRVPRSRLLPFFPPGFAGGSTPLTCPNCLRETSPGSERCSYCRALLADASPQESVPKVPVWSTLILLVAVASGAFYLGQKTRPTPAGTVPGRPAASNPAAVTTPRPTLARGRFVTGAGITETGPGWVIYTSLDRLTDRPLFGARFSNQTGEQLFNVLCANGRSVLALERGLVPSPEAASGNGKSVVSAIETSRRAAAREGRRLALRFDEAPAEFADVAPGRPAAFLRRVAASRRIRTATDEFETAGLGVFVERVIAACGFDSARTKEVRSAGSRVQS